MGTTGGGCTVRFPSASPTRPAGDNLQSELFRELSGLGVRASTFPAFMPNPYFFPTAEVGTRWAG